MSAERSRGLGRGLSALLGEAAAVVEAPDTNDTANVVVGLDKPIELLVRNPDQPRKVFSDVEIDDLAASIREKGVLQPILVRPAPKEKDKFQIIAGERRWRAAQKAGLHTVPVIVRELNDLEVLEVGIVENVQRTDLNPIEEAQAYRVLMERFGRTQDAVAQVVSKSRSHVANSLRLLSLPEDVQDHVLHGRLSAGHARAIAAADDPSGLAALILEKGLSVRQAEALAREAQAGTSGRATAPKARRIDADTLALEQDLQEALGLQVRLEDKGGKGELKLAYGTLEQLDELCRRLMRG